MKPEARILDIKHNDQCDVDPKTLTWKRDFKKDEAAKICHTCAVTVQEKKYKKGNKVYL